MKIRVHKNKDVGFLNDENKEIGFGFLHDEGIALVRCPKCGLENYAMNVLSGKCTWCDFNANTLDFE